MLSNWFRKRRLTKLAAHVQARLGPQLRRDYGVSPQYTAVQVERSTQRAHLPPQALAFCYAATLSESAFQEMCPCPPAGYAVLRQILQECAARSPVSSGIEPAPENREAFAGAGDSPSFHGS